MEEHMKKVVIEISGGIADVINKPKGVEVIIRDYDTDACGREHPEIIGNEKDGYHFESVWKTTDEV
jgi:hypothetical protein